MLAPGVTNSGVIEPPVDLQFSFFPLNKGMAELMKNHLSQIVVRIKLIGCRDQDATFPIERSISLRGPDDLKSNSLRTANPDLFKGVLIGVSSGANEHQGG